MAAYTIGEAQTDGALTLYPLLDGNSGGGGEGGRWLLLADALAEGLLEVTEVGNGIVGELVATNRAASPILILDGEQLIGAKQNRTTSRTILVGASSITRIPVSCMEQGRWAHRTAAMRKGDWHSPSKVRRHARYVEAEAVRGDDADPAGPDPQARARRPRRDVSPSALLSMAQADVWHEIRDSEARAGVRSGTGALNEVYDGNRATLEARASAFPLLPGQVGFVAFAGTSPLGVDRVADPSTFERLHHRLVLGYLFDAVDRESERDRKRASGSKPEPAAEQAGVGLEAAEALLADVTASQRRPLPTAGLGEYRVLAGTLVGGELEWEGMVVHLSAFPRD